MEGVASFGEESTCSVSRRRLLPSLGSIPDGTLGSILEQAAAWGCTRLHLTSEPENTAAQATWNKLGFVNVPGDHEEHGVSITREFKGQGKDRAVYELLLGELDR